MPELVPIGANFGGTMDPFSVMPGLVPGIHAGKLQTDEVNCFARTATSLPQGE